MRISGFDEINGEYRKTATKATFLSSISNPSSRFVNALIYAGIWPHAIRGLGRHTKTGSSLLIMGLCGNAIMPQIYGLVADKVSLAAGYWVLIPCFIYLIFYATYGYKVERWTKRQ